MQVPVLQQHDWAPWMARTFPPGIFGGGELWHHYAVIFGVIGARHPHSPLTTISHRLASYMSGTIRVYRLKEWTEKLCSHAAGLEVANHRSQFVALHDDKRNRVLKNNLESWIRLNVQLTKMSVKDWTPNNSAVNPVGKDKHDFSTFFSICIASMKSIRLQRCVLIKVLRMSNFLAFVFSCLFRPICTMKITAVLGKRNLV